MTPQPRPAATIQGAGTEWAGGQAIQPQPWAWAGRGGRPQSCPRVSPRLHLAHRRDPGSRRGTASPTKLSHPAAGPAFRPGCSAVRQSRWEREPPVATTVWRWGLDSLGTPWGAARVPAGPALSLALSALPRRPLFGSMCGEKGPGCMGTRPRAVLPPQIRGAPPSPRRPGSLGTSKALPEPGSGPKHAWSRCFRQDGRVAQLLGPDPWGSRSGRRPRDRRGHRRHLGPRSPALPTPSTSGRDPRHPHKMLLEMLLVITPVSDPEHLQKPLSTSQTLKATPPSVGRPSGSTCHLPGAGVPSCA